MDITALFLGLSAILFAIGLYGLISKRTMLRMLLAAEINFNAALLALVALASESISPATGEVVAVLATGIAAADVGIMISIAMLMYRMKRRTDVYELKESKG